MEDLSKTRSVEINLSFLSLGKGRRPEAQVRKLPEELGSATEECASCVAAITFPWSETSDEGKAVNMVAGINVESRSGEDIDCRYLD